MSKEAKTIQLRCEECGGTMTIDKSRSVLSCQYCGSTKIVADSDEVKMERIRNERIKDIEVHKQDQEMEKWKAHETERNNIMKYGVPTWFAILFIIIYIIYIIGYIGTTWFSII